MARRRRSTKTWRRLLWNGAHDSAYGCVHDQVARDVDTRYDEVERLVEGVVGEAARSAWQPSTSAAGTLRWNPSPFERDGIPGLGWVVESHGTARPTSRPLDLQVDNDATRARGPTARLTHG